MIKKSMNKIMQVLGVLVMLLPFFTVFASPQLVTAEEATPGEATIELHKKKMTEFPNPLVQNTGDIMDYFDKYEGLADVTFNIYDASKEFYEYRKSGDTVAEATKKVQDLTKEQLDNQTAVVPEESTDADGNLTFKVPKKNKAGKDAVYLIIETKKSGVTAGANLVVVFPVYKLDENGKPTDVELNHIHLYPKNIIDIDGTVDLHKIGSANKEDLNGAEFIVSREEAGVTKYLSGAKDGIYLWTTVKEDAHRFVTGNIYTPGESDINEVAGEKGHLVITGLEQGGYKITEVKAPDNANLIDGEIEQDFTIEEGHTTESPLELEVINDTIKLEKTTPQLEGEDVEIGQRIQYQLKANIPLGIQDKIDENTYKYTKFTLTDKHDSALTFENATTGDYAYVLKDGDKVIPYNQYTVVETTNGFTVSINKDYIHTLTPGGSLTFDYYMYLNEKASPENGFKNEADAEAGNETDTITPPEKPEVTVKTGGKRFIKMDADTDKPLAGAEFVVLNEDGKYLHIAETTNAVTWVDTEEEATKFKSGKDGIIDIKGLEYGIYYLKEVTPPEGYVEIKDEIKFVVDTDSYGKPGELVDPTGVMNKHKGTLPETGGMGIVLFVVAGIAIAGTAVLYFKKRTDHTTQA